MIVVSATFGGLPFVIMSWYLARISGLCLAATRAGDIDRVAERFSSTLNARFTTPLS